MPIVILIPLMVRVNDFELKFASSFTIFLLFCVLIAVIQSSKSSKWHICRYARKIYRSMAF